MTNSLSDCTCTTDPFSMASLSVNVLPCTVKLLLIKAIAPPLLAELWRKVALEMMESVLSEFSFFAKITPPSSTASLSMNVLSYMTSAQFSSRCITPPLKLALLATKLLLLVTVTVVLLSAYTTPPYVAVLLLKLLQLTVTLLLSYTFMMPPLLAEL